MMHTATESSIRDDANFNRGDSFDECRERFLNEVRHAVGEKRFSLFFEEKACWSLNDDRLTVGLGSPFLVNWFQREYRELLSKLAREIIGPVIDIEFVVDSALSAATQVAVRSRIADAAITPKAVAVNGRERRTAATGPQQLMARIASPLPLEVGSSEVEGRLAQQEAIPQSSPASVPRMRKLADLGEFLATPANEMALGAARQVASGQPFPFSPLYFYGGVGIGKTHLLEGICRELRRQRPQWNVQLLSAETFANLFTQALREKSLPGFRQRFRQVDVLLMDDIDFFEVTRAIRDEFFHTFQDLQSHGRTVILAADRHPRLLTNLGDDLITRFQSGLVCRLESPDLETRKRIIAAKTSKLETPLADETIEFVAQRFKSNVRELEGALNCLQAWRQMTGKKVTITQARQVLGDLERDCLKIIRLADVEQVVCNLFGVKSKELRSASRSRVIAQPRMVAMFLARRHTTAAYTEIGQHFGGRNHSTVMAAERKVSEWLKKEESVRISTQEWKLSEVIGTLEQQLLAG